MHTTALLHAIALAAMPMTTSAAQSNETQAAAAATKFVRDFFAAFDQRDIPHIRDAFDPSAKIVHDDGVEQTVPELIESVSNAKNWYPRTREIADCDVQRSGVIVIAGCINRVTFRRPDGSERSTAYDETWILRRTPSGLKAVRTHYSRIRKAAHVE